MKKLASTITLLLLFFVLSAFYLPPIIATENPWAIMEPMPTARAGIGVAVVDGKIYAIGGHEGWFGTPISAANERYTPLDFVPEFPAWTPMLLVITMLAVAVVVYRRRLLKN